MKKAKILLVDDEPDVLEFIGYNLKNEGYEVRQCESGIQALKIAKDFIPDLILLDVMMPGMDGIETCLELRKMPESEQALIAFLSARNEDYSQVAGFEAGADDYISKPIRPRVLLSRVKALLRRKITDAGKKQGGLHIDTERYIVEKDGMPTELPRKEFELLALLMSVPGRVFSREQIMNKVWGTEVIVGDRTIDVHIRRLRQRFGEHYIKTVKGIGYKFSD